MPKEILVNVSPRETRAAVVENGVVQEVYVEHASRRGLIGNIYKGKVSRVLPGMQAAFVDLGLERAGFLHVSDMAGGRQDDGNGDAQSEDIRRRVSEGQELLVQVVKDPLGSKGARLTTFVTFPSRYLVYLPRGNAIGISSRIEDEDEKLRLRGLLETMMDEQRKGAFIVRTAAEGADFDALRTDMMYLLRLWDVVEKDYAQALPEKSCMPISVCRCGYSVTCLATTWNAYA